MTAETILTIVTTICLVLGLGAVGLAFIWAPIMDDPLE